MNILLNAKQFEIRPIFEQNHICSHNKCKPENESSMKKRGLLSINKPYVTNDRIFICMYGNIHECSIETCMNNDICPISGLSDGHVAEYSSYSRKDPRTFIKDKYKRKRITKDDIYEKAEYIIDCILYSNYRETINEKFRKQQTKLCNKEKNAYTKEEYPVNLVQLAMIQDKYNVKILPLEILERDQQRIDYYTYLVTQMYSKIQTYMDDKISVEAITLGLLYKMKQGLKIDGITIIPIDIFLVENLPIMTDLPIFGMDKRNFTKGEKCITYMIDLAQKKGISLHELALEERNIEIVKVFKPTSRKIKK